MKKVAVAVIVLVVLVGGGIFFASRNKSSNSAASAGSTANQSAMSNMSNMSNSTSSSSTSSQSSQAVATDKVTIQNFAFSPAAITVKKGTAVTWTNQDSVAHTVQETDGQDGPKSSDLNQGASYTFTYNTVGTFKYHCSIHPNMIGTVTVTE